MRMFVVCRDFQKKTVWRLNVIIMLAKYLICHTNLCLEFSYCVCIVYLYQTSACLCLKKCTPTLTNIVDCIWKYKGFLLVWGCFLGFFCPTQIFLPGQPLCFQWICHKCLYSWLLQKVSLQLFFSRYMEWFSFMCKLLVYRDQLFSRLVTSCTLSAILLCSCSSAFTVQFICICKKLAWCSSYLHLHYRNNFLPWLSPELVSLFIVHCW